VRVIGQEQTVPPKTQTLGPWVENRGRVVTKEDTKARHPIRVRELSARTFEAVFPLMLLDEMATVPALTATPPPWANNQQKVSLKAMGTYERERAHC
jgi:hypothetical protein